MKQDDDMVTIMTPIIIRQITERYCPHDFVTLNVLQGSGMK